MKKFFSAVLTGIRIFELKTDDIESFYAQLKEEGVQVSERYDNYPCSKYFDVVDPDGNTITIAEWFKN